MFYLPRLKQIQAPAQLQAYSTEYEACSGLPIPAEYLQASANRVFGLFYQGELVGGFVLGSQTDFRTIQFFAAAERQAALYDEMGALDQYTEITCFFIKKQFRTNTFLNFSTWLGMTYAIRRYGKQQLLFGTNSPSLARLYSQTHRSVPFHEDRVNGKPTFVFRGERHHSVMGMLAIMRHKLQRVWTVNRMGSKRRSTALS